MARAFSGESALFRVFSVSLGRVASSSATRARQRWTSWHRSHGDFGRVCQGQAQFVLHGGAQCGYGVCPRGNGRPLRRNGRYFACGGQLQLLQGEVFQGCHRKGQLRGLPAVVGQQQFFQRGFAGGDGCYADIAFRLGDFRPVWRASRIFPTTP